MNLLKNEHTRVYSIREAVAKSEVVLMEIPPTAIFEIIELTGNFSDKIIIDATNSDRATPEPYKTVYHFLTDKIKAEVVKCFNTTGFENMLNPVYNGELLEDFALSWINLAIMQGHGRNMAFKVVRR